MANPQTPRRVTRSQLGGENDGTSLLGPSELDTVLSAARSARKSCGKTLSGLSNAPRSPLACLASKANVQDNRGCSPSQTAKGYAPPKSPGVGALIARFEAHSAKKEISCPVATPEDLKKLNADIHHILSCRDSQEFTRPDSGVNPEPGIGNGDVAARVAEQPIVHSGRFSWPHYATRKSVEAYEEELHLPEEGTDLYDEGNELPASDADIDSLCTALEGMSFKRIAIVLYHEVLNNADPPCRS